MQESRYGRTDVNSEYLIYPFQSPIQYNVNYTGSFSKYSIVDRYYANSLVKPVKRLYYGGAEWSDVGAVSLTFSLTDLAYTFGDQIIYKTASYPSLSAAVSDSTHDRIDAIVINEEGEIKIKQGTPAASPKRPSISEDEVLIQYALVKKASHSAANKIGTREIVYEKSGSSWTPSSYQTSGSISGSVNFASTANPYIFDSCVAANTDYRTGIDFFKTIGTINRSDYASLTMRLRLNQSLASDRYLSVSIYGTSSFVAGTASSSTINLMPYGIQSELVGQWQHIVVPTIKFGGKVETIKGVKFRMIGGASASNTSWDLDYVLFQTGVDYDEYMDASNSSYTTTNISTTSTGGGGSGGGSFSLTVEDYATGGSFTDIEKIIFRGNTVVVNTLPSPNGLTAMGVAVTQDTPKEVMVWIPAPNYVNSISPTIDNSGFARYVSLPSTDAYSESAAPGTFGVGSWTPLADFQANGSSTGTTRTAKNSTSFSPFVQSSPFSVNNNATTTIKFEVFKEDGTTAIRTITKALSAATQNQTHSLDDLGKSGASLTLGALTPDQDKFKLSSLTATLNMSQVLQNGGRFFCRLTHVNGSDGTKVFNTSTFIYDSDGTTTSATVGSVVFDEKTASIRRFSGIAYYGSGSTFALTASNISLLNEITFPTTKQIDFVANNLAITNGVAPNTGASSLNGHADGTKSGVGVAITGWAIDYNNSGLTFSRTATINDVMLNDGTNTNFNGISGIYIPGFSPHSTNALDASKVSSVTVRLFDYGSPDVSLTSSTRKTLIDTDVPNATTSVSKPIDSEAGRLSFSQVFTDGSAAFDSTLMLGTNPLVSGELQYIFGRMIYPQHDFSTYMPYFNYTSGSDYSALSGVTQNFDAVTVSGLNGSAATTPASLSGYRWYVSSYSKSNSSAFTGGVFRFECNWLETDLHCRNGVSANTGSEDLAIVIGFDSSGGSLTPDKFLFVTGNSGVYGGRTLGSTNQLTGVGTNNNISFTKGLIGAPLTKCWLFVGYKNTARGKALILSDVLFTGN